jgi:hypothetical protein
MQPSPFAKVITEPRLRELAGGSSWDRGRRYFESGAVERLSVRNDRVTARVNGSELYTVKLWPEGRKLAWHCTCPMGEDGAFCKHAVATGLAWIHDQQDGAESETDADLDTLHKSLAAREKSELVEIILEHAAEDEEFAGARRPSRGCTAGNPLARGARATRDGRRRIGRAPRWSRSTFQREMRAQPWRPHAALSAPASYGLPWRAHWRRRPRMKPSAFTGKMTSASSKV